MEEFLEHPNCPDSTVRLVVVGEAHHKAINALTALDISVLKLSPHSALDEAVSSHSDMIFTHIGFDKAVSFECSENTNKLLNTGLKIATDNVPFSPYPNDALYNILCLGEYFFYNPASAAKSSIKSLIDDGKIPIRVKQGYTKCSCAVLSKNAFITSDQSIAKVARGVGLEVLLIQPGFVELKGYKYGFIGGCCGLISKDKLAVCGSILNHPNHEEINDFAKRQGVEIITLYDGPLEDIGSIIPIKQLKI